MTYSDLKSISYLSINDEQLEQIQKYTEFTLLENEKYDLTANKTLDTFLVRNVVDSLLIAKFYDFNDKKVLDIGTGAGFPGILLAIYFKKGHFVLIEPMLKRYNFLLKVKELLKLENVEILRERAEDYAKKVGPVFDVATSRAVSKLNMLLELSIPFLKVNGIMIGYKGLNLDNEINESQNALKVLDSKVTKIHETNLDFSDENRKFIEVTKLKPTNKKYPRAFKLISSKPL